MAVAETALLALVLEFQQDGRRVSSEAVASLHREACVGEWAPSCRASEWVGEKDGYALGDLARAASILSPACDAGDALACVVVGWSRTAKEDLQGALDIQERACGLGLPRGCAEAGFLVKLGAAGQPDPQAAFSRLMAACDAGVGNACMASGDMLGVGEGRPPDPTASAALYQKACDLGDLLGCWNLGTRMFDAEGVSQDAGRIVELWGRACNGGVERACADLEAHPSLVADAAEPEPEGLADADDETWGWERLFTPAAIALGVAFVVGSGMVRTRKMARQIEEETRNWHAAAREADLSSSGRWPNLRMEGLRNGILVQVQQWTTGGRSSRGNASFTRHSRSEAIVPTALPPMRLEMEGLQSIFEKMVGETDISTGDPGFDEKFFVRGPDAEALRAALGPQTRAALLHCAKKLGPDTSFADNAIVHTRGGLDAKDALFVLDEMAACAEAILKEAEARGPYVLPASSGAASGFGLPAPASGARIKSHTAGTAVILPVFAVLASGAAAFAAWALYTAPDEMPLVIRGFLMVVVGAAAILDFAAVNALAQWQKFGSATLALRGEPRVGGALDGTFEAPLQTLPTAPVRIWVRCDLDWTLPDHRSDHDDQTGTVALWHKEVTVDPVTLHRVSPTEVHIPLNVPIELAAAPSGPRPWTGRDGVTRSGLVRWTVQVWAEQPGLDWIATFPLTVR